MFSKYRTAQNAGSLRECLETEKPITKRTFDILFNYLYEYYCYDERIKADRYILKDMEKNYGLPTWLHKYK